MLRHHYALCSPLFLTFAVLFATSTPAAAGPIFTGVGDLPGGTVFSRIRAVSADGTTVVGNSNGADGTQAFTWNLSAGMREVLFPGGVSSSDAFGVSRDGSIVVGNVVVSNGSSVRGFLRMGGGAIEILPVQASSVRAVSDDGRVVIGTGRFNPSLGSEAYIWTHENGFTPLGDIPGGSYGSQPTAISADGSVVVGSSPVLGNSDGQAFRWTAEEGMIALGSLRGLTGYSSAAAVTVTHGTIGVFGNSELLDYSNAAVAWSEDGGTQILASGFGLLDITADATGRGLLAVGYTYSDGDLGAAIWSEGLGVRSMTEFLESDFGLDLHGWTLDWAVGVSRDGRVIIGNGRNPLGQREGWVAVIPEPASILLLAVGSVFAARRRPGRPRGGSFSV